MARTNKHLPLSIAIAVVVHVGAFMLLALGYQVKQERESTPHKVINTVKAKVIDEAELVENQRRREEALRRKELERQQQLAEQKRLEQQRLKQAEKEKRLQDELEAERKKARLAEQKAKKEKKQAEEARKQAEIERKRLAEEKRRVAEQKKAEAKRRAELKKKAEAKRRAEQKKAAEAKRLAELKKRKEQEQAAIDRQRLASLEREEAELNAEAQRVLKARERSRLIAEYQDAIRNKIERNWRKPLDYQADDQCRVLVLQSLGGVVNDVVVENCTGNDEFRDSVEKAVWKADPLPEPPAPELFDREVLFTFSPKSS